MNSPWKRRMRLMLICSIAGCLLATNGTSHAMREIGGKEPVGDGPWPEGCVAVANLPTRFAYSSGDGAYEEFVYRGDTAAFQIALTAFAAIHAPALELCIHDGPYSCWWVGKEEKGYVDWTFTVSNPEEWHAIFNRPEASFYSYQSRGFQPVPAPRFDVYAGVLPTPGGIDWTLVKLPENIRVIDQRARVKKTPPAPVNAPMISGSIYDMANGKAIAGAKVLAQKADQGNWLTVSSGTADATGRFQIETLPQGSYQLAAVATGYASRVLDGVSIEPDSHLRIDGELSAEVSIKGTVANDLDVPLPGIAVQVEYALGIDGRVYGLPATLEAKTDANGRFTLTGAPTGFARFNCQYAGLAMLNPHTLWRLASWKSIVGDSVKKTGEVPVALHMTPPGAIRCKVVSTDGQPLKGDWDASIAEAEGGYGSGRFTGKYQRTEHVQPDGTVNFAELPVGRYFVVIGYWVDMAAEVKTVKVTSGQIVETTLSVKPRPVRKPEMVDPKPVKPPKPVTEDHF